MIGWYVISYFAVGAGILGLVDVVSDGIHARSYWRIALGWPAFVVLGWVFAMLTGIQMLGQWIEKQIDRFMSTK